MTKYQNHSFSEVVKTQIFTNKYVFCTNKGYIFSTKLKLGNTEFVLKPNSKNITRVLCSFQKLKF